VFLGVACNRFGQDIHSEVFFSILYQILFSGRFNSLSFSIPELLFFAFSELFGSILVRRFVGRFSPDFFEGIIGGCLVHLCG
jgi:hypothetical protein